MYRRRYESRHSPKPNKIWRKTTFNMANGILTPCNVARSWHWLRQVTAPCKCDMWLWDDIPLNLPKRLPYWHSTSGFDFNHITAVTQLTCHSAPVSEILSKSTILGRKKWRRFSRCRISAILYFMGPIMASSNSPCTTSYSSSIDTIALNRLAFDNRVFAHSLAERSATGMVVA